MRAEGRRTGSMMADLHTQTQQHVSVLSNYKSIRVDMSLPDGDLDRHDSGWDGRRGEGG